MSIAKEGIPFIVVPIAAGAVVLLLCRGWWGCTAIGAVLVLLGLFSAFFFRDPVRVIPAGDNLVLSPCDGTVMEIAEENSTTVVRVFLSVFNVHLQRAPLAGEITGVKYCPGKCVPAMKPEAQLVNEQNIITMKTAHGEFVVRQIAGILARRVVSWVKAGDRVEKGQHIGLIKFGSQVDLHMPKNVAVKVKVNDKVTGGETIIGEIR
jgi:phosphatidylserine decarboxylase